jgi:hypothetical protein
MSATWCTALGSDRGVLAGELEVLGLVDAGELGLGGDRGVLVGELELAEDRVAGSGRGARHQAAPWRRFQRAGLGRPVGWRQFGGSSGAGFGARAKDVRPPVGAGAGSHRGDKGALCDRM